MKYFMVKSEYDNTKRKDGSILVANELYTQKEIERFGINSNVVEEVEVSKNKVYFFFGARFEMSEAN